MIVAAVLALSLTPPPSISADQCRALHYRPSWSVKACRSTRDRVLGRSPSAIWDDFEKPCKVQGGLFPDELQGGTILAIDDGEAIDIDHLRPSVDMFVRLCLRHGGDPPKRLWRKVFNDEDNLYITTASANRSKGDDLYYEYCPGTPATRKRLAKKARRFDRKRKFQPSDKEEAGLQAWEDGRCL